MKHTAKRLLPYAKHGVIHINDVRDPALKRLIKNKDLTPMIRRALKEFEGDYELLIPYQVDDEELQLKRHVLYKLGRKINLSELKTSYHKYYLKLYRYGSPAEVLERWGVEVEYSTVLTENKLLERLSEIAQSGVIKSLSSNNKLYQAVAYQSRKKGVSVPEYLESNGYFMGVD